MFSLVAKNIKEQCLISPGQTVIVAVSGGADSVALLHILSRLSQELPFRLHVASLDHGLRGPAAEADVEHVQALAQDLSLPFTAGRAQARDLANERGIGIEAAARKARYDFLARVAMRQEAFCIAVGHHAQDQIETILLHIIRGSGGKGLRGMNMRAPLPGHAGLTLIRPLLTVRREQIEVYCADNRLAYRHDSSNDDTGHARNFLRHQIVRPMLARFAHLPLAFERLAAAAAADHDYLDARFELDTLPMVEVHDDAWRIARADFQACHVAMRWRLLRAAFRRLQSREEAGEEAGKEAGKELRFALTRELSDWAVRAQAGKIRALGAGMQLRLSYDSLYIERQDAQPRYPGYRLIAPGTEIALRGPGEIAVGNLRIALIKGGRQHGRATALYVPADAELRLRTRRRGERFQPKGMAGRSRKIKDWMIDRKIPRQIRDQIPVLSLDGAVIAICLGDTWRLAACPQEPRDPRKRLTLLLD